MKDRRKQLFDCIAVNTEVSAQNAHAEMGASSRRHFSRVLADYRLQQAFSVASCYIELGLATTELAHEFFEAGRPEEWSGMESKHTNSDGWA
jgi:hypothetical protein